jgi:hypothetical protein
MAPSKHKSCATLHIVFAWILEHEGIELNKAVDWHSKGSNNYTLTNQFLQEHLQVGSSTAYPQRWSTTRMHSRRMAEGTEDGTTTIQEGEEAESLLCNQCRLLTPSYVNCRSKIYLNPLRKLTLLLELDNTHSSALLHSIYPVSHLHPCLLSKSIETPMLNKLGHVQLFVLHQSPHLISVQASIHLLRLVPKQHLLPVLSTFTTNILNLLVNSSCQLSSHTSSRLSRFSNLGQTSPIVAHLLSI